ncbi:MAG: SDR family NAD(P)-dependent oxidoreductase [Candidatus Marinimicrobia bacterium]|nr:SDR family NAD(P)-dependent oxidoreductase [Candidatus Neomarinimicrobiota bacterium]
MNHHQPASTVVFVTGASSGIGKSTAKYLSQLGYVVYGTSRRPGSYPQPEHFTMLEMDVRNEMSVKETVRYIVEKEGKIDVLVNNAGYGIGGAIEDTSPKMVEEQMNTNFFGIFRVLHYVLPVMKKQEHGLIINMSSIGGVIGLPYQGIYSASKFAVEGLTEALYKELFTRNIKVVMVEPGDFKTGFTANREIITKEGKADIFEKSREVIEHDEQSGQPPIKIAYLIEKIMNKKHPRLRYSIGAFDQKLSILLKKILPDRWFDLIIMKYYKVK